MDSQSDERQHRAPTGYIEELPASRSCRGTDCFALDDDTKEPLKNPAGTRLFASMEANGRPDPGRF